MEKVWKFCYVILVCSCSVVLGMLWYWHVKLPSTYKVEKGESLQINGLVEATVALERERAQSVNSSFQNEYHSTLQLCGIFPIKEVTVSVVDAAVVTIGGTPFGIKLYTDGVLIVSLSDVMTDKGKCSPARSCGLKAGDVIVSVNGNKVFTNKEVAEMVEQSKGKTLVLQIRRDKILFTVNLKPELSKNEKKYKAGLWVRDSSAGIGTVTFYDAKSGVLAGLGHPICDVDTGEIIPICGGEIVPARIYGVTKSTAGSPGELRGGFDPGTLGRLAANEPSGIYGLPFAGKIGDTYPVALKQEIVEGDGQIYTTINGTKPAWYSVKIRNVNYKDASITRNMLIEITDKKLLDITGGIVQGMSGSPIIQNGKLVGAVTHVLVNDPTRGYGIFIENMLEAANTVAKEQEMKDAS